MSSSAKSLSSSSTCSFGWVYALPVLILFKMMFQLWSLECSVCRSTVEADRILCPRKLTSNSFRGKSASCVPNTFPRNCHNRIRPSQRFPEVPWADSLKTGKVKYTKPRSGNYSALPYPINMQFSAPFTIYQYHWTLNILFSTCSIHGWTAG